MCRKPHLLDYSQMVLARDVAVIVLTGEKSRYGRNGHLRDLSKAPLVLPTNWLVGPLFSKKPDKKDTKSRSRKKPESRPACQACLSRNIQRPSTWPQAWGSKSNCVWCSALEVGNE